MRHGLMPRPGPDGEVTMGQQIDARYVIMPPRVSCAFRYLDFANLIQAGMVTPQGETAIEGRPLNKDESQTYVASLQTLRAYIMGEISADPEPLPEETGPEEDTIVIKDLNASDLADLMEVAKKRAAQKMGGLPPEWFGGNNGPQG